MQKTYRTLFVILILGLFIMRPVTSYADWNGHNNDGHGHGYGHHDHSYVGVNLSVWPDSYYYGAPYYPPADEVLVSPPVYDYQAVEPPVTVVQQPLTDVQPVEITTPVTTSDTSDSFTINIPNNKGGYTAVTLKKSGNGFIGPQGEFYSEFPKVSQLEVMYGK